MSQTLTRLLVHIIFATKDRHPLITGDIEPETHAYLGGIARNLDSPGIAIGGAVDHVHLLVSLSKNMALPQNQKEHHRRMTFQEEYLEFLKKYKVPYDERYIWT